MYLQPTTKAAFTFIVYWHRDNRYVNKPDRSWFSVTDGRSRRSRTTILGGDERKVVTDWANTSFWGLSWTLRLTFNYTEPSIQDSASHDLLPCGPHRHPYETPFSLRHCWMHQSFTRLSDAHDETQVPVRQFQRRFVPERDVCALLTVECCYRGDPVYLHQSLVLVIIRPVRIASTP